MKTGKLEEIENREGRADMKDTFVSDLKVTLTGLAKLILCIVLKVQGILTMASVSGQASSRVTRHPLKARCFCASAGHHGVGAFFVA